MKALADSQTRFLFGELIYLSVVVGHPISYDNGLISQIFFIKIRILLPIACGHGCCLVMFEIWSFYPSLI